MTELLSCYPFLILMLHCKSLLFSTGSDIAKSHLSKFACHEAGPKHHTIINNLLLEQIILADGKIEASGQ